jgi:hypothetical protein
MSTLYQNPALPQQPTDEDLAAFTRPVAEMDMSQQAAPVAQPRAAKGLSFDWSVMNAQTQEEYDAKPPAIRQLIHEIQTQGILPSQEAAATRVMEIQKMLDEQASPKAQAEIAKASVDLEKSKLDVQQAQAKIAERNSVQAEFKIRKQNTLKTINEILNDPGYKSLVGPFDGTAGRVYDAAFDETLQAKRAKLDRLVNFDVLEMTKYLRPVSQDELKYLRTLVPSQTRHWEVYKQYLTEQRDILEATNKARVNPATNETLLDGEDASSPGQAAPAQPQQPAPQNIRKTPAGDLIQLPNGKYYPAQFYRP